MGRILTSSSSRTNTAYIPSNPTSRTAVPAGVDVVGRLRKSYDAPRAGSLSSTPRQTTTSPMMTTSPSVRATRSRLQKAAGWTSSSTDPMRPQLAPKPAIPGETLATIPSLGRATMVTAKARTRIKPLFRKRSADTADSLDLGRSVTEDDGLGIYGSAVRTGARSIDVSAGPALRKGSAHHRSASGASQFSTATAGSATRPYVHPMRQTPRPFTPPIARSYATSTLGSDLSTDGPDVAAVDEEMVRRAMRDASACPISPYSSSYVSSPPPPLRLHTGGSASPLPFDSHSVLGGTPSSFRPRMGTLTPTGTISPTSRTSSDMAFRPRHPADLDAASRAASIRAAREAFTEREAAKVAQEERRRQRQLQKQAKRGGQRRAKVERKKAAAGRTPSTDQIQPSEKDDGFIPMPPFDMTLPVANHPDASHRPVDMSPAPSLDAHRHSGTALKTTWIHFITWLRTRLYRFRRKIIRAP